MISMILNERSYCPTSLSAVGDMSIVDFGHTNRCIVDDASFLDRAKHVPLQGFTITIPFAWNVLPSHLLVFCCTREAFV